MDERMKMRMQIAEDVLAMLAGKKLGSPTLEPMTGKYLEVYGEGGTNDVQTFLKQSEKCEVCALGAMFVADIDRNNELKFTDLYFAVPPSVLTLSRQGATSRLLQYFNSPELAIIENGFEGDDYDARWYGHGAPELRMDQKLEERFRYVFHHMTPETRLEVLMQHLIKHGGALVPVELMEEAGERMQPRCDEDCVDCLREDDPDRFHELYGREDDEVESEEA